MTQRKRILVPLLTLFALACVPAARAQQYTTLYNPFTGKLDYVNAISGQHTNGTVYWDGTGLVSTATGGAGTLCLVSTDGAAPVWGSCAGSTSTAWSSLSNPSGNMALSMGTNTSTFTTGTGTSTANLWTWQDTTGNTGTGYLATVSTVGTSTLKPMRICSGGTTNCITVDANALMSASGSATIVATQAATLTTARAIYGNNFDGSAALAQVIASTFGGTGNGFTKFTGPATSEKTFTLPNASATVLTDNALVTAAQGGTANGFFAVSGPATSTKTFTFPNASSTVLTSNAVVTIAQGGTGTGSTLTGLVRGSGSAMTGAELSGDATTSGSNAVTVTKLNGTSLAGLATGIVKNTTATGVPSIATDNDTDSVAFCSDAGSTDAYACSLSPVIASYVTGTHYRFKAATANTGAATINLNTIGAKTIVKVAGGITTALADNDIRSGQWVDLVYDGTNMQMQSMVGNTPAGTTTYTNTIGGTGAINPTVQAWFTDQAASVKSWGAAGDGVTDDTTAIQNAINAVQGNVGTGNDNGKNGSLYFPPGRYLISGSGITVGHSINFYGGNGNLCSLTNACGVEIYYTGTTHAITIEQTGGADTVHRVWMHDFTLSSAGGAGVSDIGIYINNAEECFFDRLHIGDYGPTGTNRKGFTSGIRTTHYAIGAIRNCDFETDTYGYDVNGGFSAAITISDNNFYQVTASVRMAGGSQDNHILNNWNESVDNMVLIDSTSSPNITQLQIVRNHLSNAGGPILNVTSVSGTVSLTGIHISDNNMNQVSGSSFINLSAAAYGDFYMTSNNWYGTPTSVFGGAATAVRVIPSDNNFNGQTLGAMTVPTVSFGAGAGGTPTSTSIAGTYNDGVVTFTTGGTAPSSAAVFTVTWPNAWSANVSSCVITPGTSAAAAKTANMYVSSLANDTFTVTNVTSALANTTAYKWYYHCGGPY